MHTIIVPTQHIERLKQQGIYDAWLANVKDDMKRYNRLSHNWSGQTWSNIIGGTFIWDATPEGYEYWEKLQSD